MYCQLTDQANPSIAFLENRIVVISKGIRIGNLKLTSMWHYFLLLEAMALTIDNTEAKPELPNTTAMMNEGKILNRITYEQRIEEKIKC